MNEWMTHLGVPKYLASPCVCKHTILQNQKTTLLSRKHWNVYIKTLKYRHKITRRSLGLNYVQNVRLQRPHRLRDDGVSRLQAAILLLSGIVWYRKPNGLIVRASPRSVVYRLSSFTCTQWAPEKKLYTGWPKKTGPACFIANILKTPRPNCVKVGELLQYCMPTSNYLFV